MGSFLLWFLGPLLLRFKPSGLWHVPITQHYFGDLCHPGTPGASCVTAELSHPHGEEELDLSMRGGITGMGDMPEIRQVRFKGRPVALIFNQGQCNKNLLIRLCVQCHRKRMHARVSGPARCSA